MVENNSTVFIFNILWIFLSHSSFALHVWLHNAFRRKKMWCLKNYGLGNKSNIFIYLLCKYLVSTALLSILNNKWPQNLVAQSNDLILCVGWGSAGWLFRWSYLGSHMRLQSDDRWCWVIQDGFFTRLLGTLGILHVACLSSRWPRFLT